MKSLIVRGSRGLLSRGALGEATWHDIPPRQPIPPCGLGRSAAGAAWHISPDRLRITGDRTPVRRLGARDDSGIGTPARWGRRSAPTCELARSPFGRPSLRVREARTRDSPSARNRQAYHPAGGAHRQSGSQRVGTTEGADPPGGQPNRCLDGPLTAEAGSPTRTRTSNLAVNSRPLYRLSYRGPPVVSLRESCVPGNPRPPSSGREAHPPPRTRSPRHHAECDRE